MGKVLSLLVALGDLGLLALVVTARHESLWQEAGIFTGFVVCAAIVWAVALATSLYNAVRYGREWRWVLALIVLLWLPALPALCYGVWGVATQRSRAARQPSARPVAARVRPVAAVRRGRAATRAWAAPTADALLVGAARPAKR